MYMNLQLSLINRPLQRNCRLAASISARGATGSVPGRGRLYKALKWWMGQKYLWTVTLQANCIFTTMHWTTYLVVKIKIKVQVFARWIGVLKSLLIWNKHIRKVDFLPANFYPRPEITYTPTKRIGLLLVSSSESLSFHETYRIIVA